MSSLEQSYNNSVSRLALTSARKPSWRASWRYALLGWRDNELRLLVLAIWLACAATTLLGFFLLIGWSAGYRRSRSVIWAHRW